MSTGAELVGINRTSIYYTGTPVSDEELECKRVINRLHTDHPTWGPRQMSAQLKLRGHNTGRQKTRRYMREMDIHPIFPQSKTPSIQAVFKELSKHSEKR